MSCIGVLPLSHVKVPCVEVPECSVGTVTLGDYQLDDGSGSALQQTVLSLCYTNQLGLFISYNATDDNVYTSFSSCHDPVWQDDALEFMVGEGVNDPAPL